jgi:hypothetical protein
MDEASEEIKEIELLISSKNKYGTSKVRRNLLDSINFSLEDKFGE